MESRIWIFFVVLAGLCWGAYVPFVAQGGRELKSSYGSLLCVGIAYFLIAVLYPLVVFWVRGQFPAFSVKGSVLATLAGVAGALGALCVILATTEFKGDRMFVAPVIFAMAPVVNTVISLVWHPEKSLGSFSLPETMPHWSFFVGIVLAGLGAGIVLFSKEYTEQLHRDAAAKSAAASKGS
jgi:drug/metabolite transporter (DMT)-like permease